MPFSLTDEPDLPTAVIPLRAGKTRLSEVLDADSRAALRAAMLADVVVAIREAGVPRIIVAAGDAESAALADELGLEVRLDAPEVNNLDLAIAAVVQKLDGDVVVVMADLPALSSQDVRALLAASGEVVVAPTSDGGTGALLRRPGSVITTGYGPESASVHAARAMDAGLIPNILDLPGFSLDLDTAEDLATLAQTPALGAATTAWVQRVRAA